MVPVVILAKASWKRFYGGNSQIPVNTTEEGGGFKSGIAELGQKAYRIFQVVRNKCLPLRLWQCLALALGCQEGYEFFLGRLLQRNHLEVKVGCGRP